ncbi:MAG: hypothetical protein AAF682_16795 [Planctomycetota bacterium]
MHLRSLLPLVTLPALSAFAAAGDTDSVPLIGIANVYPEAGSLARLDQASFTGTIVGDTGANRISGLTQAADGRLFSAHGTFVDELDPSTGAVLGTTLFTQTIGGSMSIGDLATQPGTGVMYGVNDSGQIVTFDFGAADAPVVGGVPGLRTLAFAPDGTLYGTTLNDQLLTLDPSDGVVLTLVDLTTPGKIDGLAVRPEDGALFATLGASGGLNQSILQIDPLTGATSVAGTTGVGAGGDLVFLQTKAVEEVRNALLLTPNAATLSPGATGGPILGGVWDPAITPSAGTTSIGDILIVTTAPAELQLFAGENGVLLCDALNPPGILAAVPAPAPGAAMPIPLPLTSEAIGLEFCAQGVYVEPTGKISLTNALDVILGTF